MTMMDVRLRVYLVLTTFNSLVDLVFQDEDVLPLTIYFVGRLAILGLLLLLTAKKNARTEDGPLVRKGFASSPVLLLLRQLMSGTLLLSVAYWFYRSPAIWDSNQWAMQTDLVVALWMLVFQNDDDKNVSMLCSTVTQMFCQYYLAAGFFKINTSFLDPNASCATVFAVQHLSYYVGPFLSQSALIELCRYVKPVSPMLTLFVELSMAGCLSMGQLLNSRIWTKRGLLYILYFHLAVCLTPEPHDISIFALQCAVRLVMALEPVSLEQALVRLRPFAVQGATVACLWISYGIQSGFTPPNWSFAAFCPVIALHTMAVWLEKDEETTTTSTAQPAQTSSKPLWSYLAIGMALFYAFGSIILGLQEEATCNMFANLKIHGGSNHLLVPTGLLLKGPEVRIEATDSWWFTTTYPADFSHIIEPSVAGDVLQAIGNPKPFYFNGGANRVLGLFRKGWVQHNGVFVPYTVPALEFRRLFTEAIEHDKSFVMEYAELPGNSGDEVWRATAVQRRVQVTVQNGSVTSCKANGKPCSTDSDLVYKPYQDIPWLRRKLSMYHGYPLVVNADGNVRPTIPCFGP